MIHFFLTTNLHFLLSLSCLFHVSKAFIIAVAVVETKLEENNPTYSFGFLSIPPISTRSKSRRFCIAEAWEVGQKAWWVQMRVFRVTAVGLKSISYASNEAFHIDQALYLSHIFVYYGR